ncbi:MAG: TonB-dependent receptor [Chitinophagaceae bacterium]|nr:TonB-dependent receptor [Chitinophagaceae bacterium]
MKILLAITVFVLTSTNILAQEDTSRSRELNEVVVTGQYKPQSIKNSVYQVRTISKERIQKQAATKLQDVLNNELNIRFSQDLATGGSDITMMGLKGQNVKILVDGMPMTGRQGTSNEININQIDINSIERIEIVEGPMSVIYGADALAGVINIITKKGGSKKWNVNARIHEETVGNEYGIKQGIHNQYAGLSWRNKRWEIGGGFGHNYFGGWKDTAIARELVWHKKDQRLANGFIGYTHGKFNIRYRFDGLDEIITNPGNFVNDYQPAADTLAFDEEYLTNRLMQQLQASYFFNSNLSVQAQAAYTSYSRQVYSTTISKHTGRVSLAPASEQSLDEFNGFTFRGTALYRLSTIVSFQPGIDINLENGEGQRLKAGKNSISDFAFFLTSEITPSSKLNIRPGIRVIRNSVYNAPPIIPSINAKWALSPSLDLRAAYAKGFRSPSLRELYFDFHDTNHDIYGNPDLKAEQSNSVTGSLTWKPTTTKPIAFTTAISVFYNDVDNLIDYVYDPNNTRKAILVNVAKSKTRGVNLTGSAIHKKWNVALGASYTGFFNSYSLDDKELPELQWSPEVNANMGYTFSKIGLDVNLFYKLTGKKPRYAVNSSQQIVLTEMNAYHMADFTVNQRLHKMVLLNAGVRNLFDVDRIRSSVAGSGVHTVDGTANIAYGRSFFAGLVFNWEKKK